MTKASECNECWKMAYPKLSPKEASWELRNIPCFCNKEE